MRRRRKWIKSFRVGHSYCCVANAQMPHWQSQNMLHEVWAHHLVLPSSQTDMSWSSKETRSPTPSTIKNTNIHEFDVFLEIYHCFFLEVLCSNVDFSVKKPTSIMIKFEVQVVRENLYPFYQIRALILKIGWSWGAIHNLVFMRAKDTQCIHFCIIHRDVYSNQTTCRIYVKSSDKLFQET